MRSSRIVGGLVLGGWRSRACRPTWQVAPVDATSWGPAHGVQLPSDFPRRGTCSASLWRDEGGFEGTIAHMDHAWDLCLEPAGGGWRVRGTG